MLIYRWGKISNAIVIYDNLKRWGLHMLKVFLAEDEFVIREGIKNNINWFSNGYEFCGDASDGELAYSQILKLQPDILITDIKMPFMDGLTLSRMIKAKFPWIQIILLTGYEEFEYAKEAIKIGVASYLSKPISGEKLLTEINTVAEKIMEKKREQEISLKYQLDMKEKTEQEKQLFFSELITGSRPLSEILDKASKLSLNIDGPIYNLVLVKIWSLQHEADEYSQSVINVEDEIRKLIEYKGVQIFNLNLEGIALLFMGDNEEILNDEIRNTLNEIKIILSAYRHIRYFGGVGQCVKRITDIPVSFSWASRAYAHMYLNSENDFLFGKEEFLSSKNENVILSEVDPGHIDRKLIKEFLRRGEEAESEYFLREFLGGMGKNAMKSTMLRQYIAMDIYFCVSEYVSKELMLPKDEQKGIIPATDFLSDENKVFNYLVTIVKKAIALRKATSLSHYTEVVNEVLEYIEAHFGDENLSLNQLAAYVNVSPNYLSTVFSQQTGQSFIKYLTDYRMDKAKELLATTSKKSNEIAFIVGYKDPHYFSYLFKKTQGITTSLYRGKGASEASI